MAKNNVVLIPVDSVSEHSRAVILHALKHNVQPDDVVEVLHIIKPSLFAALKTSYEHREIDEITQQFTGFIKDIVQSSGVSNKISLNVLHGDAKGYIMMEINERSPRLVVMGAHAHGVLPGTGSITGYVSQRSPCPVLVLPHTVSSVESAAGSVPIAA
ncbi:uncharacterized protein BJ171DRAFT_72586 [Polychytrium aggregatum]|uniref:uncharacterized protein n=1 Tax=Polychytrium aggregatum TaxID=110093 RepID=UPI0022FF3746|nr:uncharacterized protein BJ171DRAFT_72586 [Polychytrium aggregatum]KAI9205358.1 hypothetical protein BJ171DRAFT_72586 [Polychytrium aggregatum]